MMAELRTILQLTKEVEKHFVFELLKVFQRGPSGIEFGHSIIGAGILSISKLLHVRKKIGK